MLCPKLNILINLYFSAALQQSVFSKVLHRFEFFAIEYRTVFANTLPVADARATQAKPAVHETFKRAFAVDFVVVAYV